MHNPYPSDISREQFTIILPILEKARKKTKPRAVDLYEVFCGILYLLKSGCQWRMIPSDFPDWETCYYYFGQWNHKPKKNQDSLLEEALKKCGWRGETKQWSQRENQLHHR
jgi:transposase